MTKIAIPSISTLPAPMQRVLAPMRDALVDIAAQQQDAQAKIVTLSELLRGSLATRPVVSDPGSLPPVSKYTVRPFDSYIAFYLNPEAMTAGYVTELWRGIGEGATSTSAQLVQETTRLGLEDHPPPGETYRYWLRYRSMDGTKNGPFSPTQGIIFVTAEPINPEDFFDPNNGGVFLETFEREDLPLHWTRKTSSGTVTLTYPLSGVVGGKVARIAGGEEWRVYNDKFEFDPSVLYRMKVGLRMSAAPTNGATSARAQVRAGFEMYDASGAVVDTTGGTAYTLAHFFAAYNIDYGAAGVGVYQEFEGYLRGLGASPANNASNVAVPSVARNGSAYFSPMFVVNFDDGDGTTEIDYIRVDALTPYSLSLSASLTNEVCAVPCDSAGTVLSYAPATGDFVIFFGLTEIDPSNLTYAIVDNPQSLTATINGSGHYAVTSGLDAGEAFAEITFSATFQGVVIEKKFTINKAIQGTAGAPGTAADAVTGTASRNTWPILCGQDNNPISGAFTNANGNFRVFLGATEVTSSATFAVVATGCTGTINTATDTPVNGKPRGYYQVTAISADAGTLELSATYSGFTVYETFTVTKAKVGYEIVGTLPSSGNYAGRVVFLTSDNKLYRYNGSAWVASVPTSDLTGQLTDSQIADLAAGKITGQLVAAQVASIAAVQITGTLTNAQLAAIDAAKVTGQLTASQIATIASTQITGTLTNAQLAAIDAAKITGQITSVQIGANAITTPKLAAGAVTANEIAANTITAAKIAAGAITATEIAAGAITAAQIAAGTITANEIAAGAITTPKLAAGAVTAAEIAAGSIIAGKIAANTISANELQANSVTATQIQTDAVTALKVAAGAIIAGKLAVGSVVAENIVAQTITAAQIAARTITAAQIAVGTLTATEIQAASITADRIVGGSITAAQIASGTITSLQIAANTIQANNIQAGTITGDRLQAGTITGTQIQAGSITAALIQAGTITADRLILGGITTDRLASNAATNGVAFDTGAFVTSIGFGSVQIAAGTLPVVAGSYVQIVCNVNLGFPNAGGVWTVECRRIGSISGNALVGTKLIPVAAFSNVAMLFTDTTLLAESANYVINVASSTSPGGSQQFLNVAMSIIEFRR